MKNVVLSEKVRQASGLVAKVACAFERPIKDEPKTLAEAVSNEIMEFMPRISPELFELKRRVNLKLTEKQMDDIDETYKTAHPYGRLPSESPQGLFFKVGTCYNWDLSENKLSKKNRGLLQVKRIITARVPSFSYTIFGKQDLCYKNAIDISYKQTWRENRDLSRDRMNLGINNLTIRGNWKPHLELDLIVKVPELPESFIELGDEAVAVYYDQIRKAPKNLRKNTSLKSPSLGILWIPASKFFYAVGEIPKIESLAPKGDPALILDIPDEKVYYRHLVAVWNIDEEIPFKNWLREYSKGSFEKVRGMKE